MSEEDEIEGDRMCDGGGRERGERVDGRELGQHGQVDTLMQPGRTLRFKEDFSPFVFTYLSTYVYHKDRCREKYANLS